MRDFDEKRDFQRMPVDCPVRYQIIGDDRRSLGIAKNLSSSGLLFIADEALPSGANLRLEVLPGRSITPPLTAEATVMRCEPEPSGDYAVACGFDRILKAEQPPVAG